MALLKGIEMVFKAFKSGFFESLKSPNNRNNLVMILNVINLVMININ